MRPGDPALAKPAGSLPAGAFARGNDPYIISDLHTRVKDLEQQLRVEKGNCAIARSKAERAIEHEEFLLSKISRASGNLLSKQPLVYVVVSFCRCSLTVFANSCACRYSN